MDKNNSTLDKILDAGRHLIQKYGYNGFSYADIAEIIGIKKASIHYYFPSKQELVRAVLQRYNKDFLNDLYQIEQQFTDPLDKLKSFFLLYRKTLENDEKICLCSMMAAEISSFPKEIRTDINRFFLDNEEWLEKVLTQKKALDVPSFSDSLAEQSKLLLTFVQGAQLLVRASGELEQYDTMVENVLKTL
ncbi:TetR/AcrR family transcriptional regulator [Chengkuizengella axinellae]|uniref:TetR/AcrR family transcriptional regulator n=1 Tax=Chengkuizengella axinellae TaxID=3064388 RepID=A0ABT9IXV4_9BACL|nr:TetR/AcrR family transcriptional regulator [Chengkuizengella sp. 2205SS18-9]MDP5274192.1 TetR/AcrR family transcriptional regulator [Chengkuizengella sp. 2205SS18-9]